ncbi:hypothetical protein FBQ97_05545 [Acidobacteria bacterium ACD]|nr:MAG: hypothetical protein EDX89_02540 [Acidobacteriota bacterium]MDL1949264.1 hypothetical protein [Acidobacteria bacterium ACD]
MNRTAILLASSSLVLLGAVPAVADPPPPTPPPTVVSAPQHVTVPGLPGQKNKEGTVKLGGEIQTDAVGNIVTQPMSAEGPKGTPAPAPAGKQPATGAPAQGGTAAVPAVPVGPAPAGPAVATGKNVVAIRGVVTAIDPGKSITVKVQRTGKDVTYTLAPKAEVEAGTKVGDSVKVRILAAEKGKVADKVELLPPPK